MGIVKKKLSELENAQTQINKFAYEYHAHNPEKCEMCYLLVQVGFLGDRIPEPDYE